MEDGTRLAARIARGELPAPDEDAAADRYLAADDMFTAHGLSWYEISNWAAREAGQVPAQPAVLDGRRLVGIGPGAHSHVGGTRWWNVKHPAAYAVRLAAGVSPGHKREVLTTDQRLLERIMLRTRLVSGCPADLLGAVGRDAAQLAVADGLADPAAYGSGRVVLTPRGRLLADAVIRDLTD